MENVCRLCASTRTPKQLISNIQDEALNIEQKLIDCCRWKLFNGYEGYSLPSKICTICLKQLEKSWAFAESVAQAQRELIDLVIEEKPLVFLQIECFDESILNVAQNDNVQEMKMPLEQDISVPEFQNSSFESFSDTKLYEEHDDDDEKDDLEVPKEDAKEPKTPEVKSDPETTRDFIRLLSDSNKLADGTICKEIVAKMNLDDWSIMKLRCWVCNIIFENHRQLKSHFDQSHNDHVFKIMCNFCEASFSRKRSINRHVINNHRPYLKYCCMRCGTFYWDLNKLKKHLLGSHPSDKQSQLSCLCEICGKSFPTKSKLSYHTRLHLPIEKRRTFECYVCKISFAYKKSLIHHLPVHWGEKIQYECNICLSKFSRTDALRRHSLIHQGKLPHQCSYCGKGFRTKFNLKVHERIHTGERPYACKYCPYRSTDGPNLGKHIKQRHKNEIDIHSINAPEIM